MLGSFGYTGAAIMGLFIIISSIATLRYGTTLSSWEGRITLKDIFTEIRLALTNKTFVIFFFGSLAYR